MSVIPNAGVLVVRKVKRSRKDQERVERLVHDNKCVVCETQEPRRRGLCPCCAARWEKSKKGLTDQQTQDLNEELMKDGFLLEADEVRRYRRPNVFRSRAELIVGKAGAA